MRASAPSSPLSASTAITWRSTRRCFSNQGYCLPNRFGGQTIMGVSIRSLLLIWLAMLAVPTFHARLADHKANYLSYAQARPILEALREIAPGDLKAAAEPEAAEAWAKWAQQRDRDIRARLNQGDEDS